MESIHCSVCGSSCAADVCVGRGCANYVCRGCSGARTCACSTPKVYCDEHVLHCCKCEKVLCDHDHEENYHLCDGGLMCPGRICFDCGGYNDNADEPRKAECYGCRKAFCGVHLIECNGCSTTWCKGCAKECKYCNQLYCGYDAQDGDNICLIDCVYLCSNICCINCAKHCGICGEAKCQQHVVGCSSPSCAWTLCFECLLDNKCTTCHKAFCGSHLEDHKQKCTSF